MRGRASHARAVGRVFRTSEYQVQRPCGRNVTGKSIQGTDVGSVGGDEIREVTGTQSRQGLVGSWRSLDLIPTGLRARTH